MGLLKDEPVLMPNQELPFNADFYIAAEFIKLKLKFGIKKAVELGSCVFGTTKWLAENFDEAITVEINQQFRNIGLERVKGIKNITSLLGDSIVMLPTMLKMCDDKTIVFIDSHWNSLPLIDELKIIKASGLQPCIAIHDCLVPDEPKLGYDTYAGVKISYDTIKPYIDAIYVDGYDYHYNSDAASTAVKRGIIYIYPKQ